MNNFDGIDEPVVVSVVGKKRKSSKCNHLREEIKKMRHSSREEEKCRLLLVPRQHQTSVTVPKTES